MQSRRKKEQIKVLKVPRSKRNLISNSSCKMIVHTLKALSSFPSSFPPCLHSISRHHLSLACPVQVGVFPREQSHCPCWPCTLPCRDISQGTKCEGARRDRPGQAGRSNWKVQLVVVVVKVGWSGQESGRRAKGQQF